MHHAEILIAYFREMVGNWQMLFCTRVSQIVTQNLTSILGYDNFFPICDYMCVILKLSNESGLAGAVEALQLWSGKIIIVEAL